MKNTNHLGLFNGVAVSPSNSDIKISHLQFADGSLIFLEANENSILMAKRILWIFLAVSGLHINIHKSSLMGINISNTRLVSCANRIRCQVKFLPCTYLGLPLGVSPNRLSTWPPIIDKLKKQLASLKANFLSLAGSSFRVVRWKKKILSSQVGSCHKMQ